MIDSIHKKQSSLPYKILCGFIALTFLTSVTLPPTPVFAQTVLNLPVPGTMVPPSSGFAPALMTGITIHPDNPLRFDFIMDRGQSDLAGEPLKAEYTKMIKYFMASLTVPEDELWVNLSPYEKDRMIAAGLGKTEMGRDMLAQDYLLKQLTASLMYSEKELGKEFWNKVYQKAREKFGTTEIPVNTFNKVWIVPDEALVYEQGSSAFVIKSRLAVMLESDYEAMSHQDTKSPSHQNSTGDVVTGDVVTTGIIREVIIPEIEKEINEGKNFANLRQIYNALILAVWYKQKLIVGAENFQPLLGQVYVDQNKTKGIDTEDKEINQKIYDQYIESFKKGVYNFIKEDVDPATQQIIPRKYFSGGMNWKLGLKTLGAFALGTLLSFGSPDVGNASALTAAAMAGTRDGVTTEFVDNGQEENIGTAITVRPGVPPLLLAQASQTPRDGTSSSPVVGEKESSDHQKDWYKVKQQFETLIDATTTQDELKRIYRKMSLTVHPDKVLLAGDKEIAHETFISLSDRIKRKLDSEFHVRRESTGAAKSQTGQSDDWLESWSYTAWSNVDDAIRELRRREKLVKSRGEENISLVTRLIANNIKNLSLRDLSNLLDITSKTEFATKLLELTAKGAITPAAMADEVVWQARPMLEKIYAARTLRKGELVHFRKGSLIVRTVILEPISETNPSLQMITPSEKLYQMLDLTQEELIQPEFDLEREPLQTGYEINIGEVFEVDLSDFGSDFTKERTTATISGVAWGQYAWVAHDVIHGNLENMGGRGFGMGRSYAVDQLRAGKIRKIIPSILTLEQQPEVVKLQGDGGITQRPNIDSAILSEEEVLAKTPDQISIGNTSVGIVQGDITQVPSDAVVPGVNTSMAVGMGVTGAIIGAVGRNNAAKVFPPPRVAIGRNSFKVGDAYVASLEGISTRAGWKYVISAMIHTGESWGEPTEDSVRASTKRALEEAGRRNLTPEFKN